MVKKRLVAGKVRGLRSKGIDVGRGGVIGNDGVFYYSEETARIVASKRKRKLLKINEPDVSGWLVLNEPASSRKQEPTE